MKTLENGVTITARKTHGDTQLLILIGHIDGFDVAVKARLGLYGPQGLQKEGVTLSWGACPEQSPEKAEMFNSCLQEAIKLAKLVNDAENDLQKRVARQLLQDFYLGQL